MTLSVNPHSAEGRVERHIELARHALGLPNRRGETYRNSFVCGPDSPDHADWMEMVRNGAAVRRDGKNLPFAGDDLFHLTRSGAEAALKFGERSRDEDLP